MKLLRLAFYTPENKSNRKIPGKIQAKTKTYRDKNLTISFIQDLQNLFSFQMNFENPFTGSGEMSSGRRDLFQLCFQRKTQINGEVYSSWGKYYLTMIDNYGNYLKQYKIRFPCLTPFSDSIKSERRLEVEKILH